MYLSTSQSSQKDEFFSRTKVVFVRFFLNVLSLFQPQDHSIMRKTLYTPADFRFLKRQQAHAKPEEERKKSMSLDTFTLSNESVCQRESGMILSKNICLIQIQ